MFVTVNVHWMVSPRSVSPSPSTSLTAACFTRVRAARAVTGASTASSAVTGPPVGGVPAVAATLCTVFASTSAWVSTYGAAVQFAVTVGGSGPTGQVTAPTFGSVTVIGSSVRVPVFVTANA